MFHWTCFRCSSQPGNLYRGGHVKPGEVCLTAALHVDRLKTETVFERAPIYPFQRAWERDLLDPAFLEYPKITVKQVRIKVVERLQALVQHDPPQPAAFVKCCTTYNPQLGRRNELLQTNAMEATAVEPPNTAALLECHSLQLPALGKCIIPYRRDTLWNNNFLQTALPKAIFVDFLSPSGRLIFPRPLQALNACSPISFRELFSSNTTSAKLPHSLKAPS